MLTRGTLGILVAMLAALGSARIIIAAPPAPSAAPAQDPLLGTDAMPVRATTDRSPAATRPPIGDKPIQLDQGQIDQDQIVSSRSDKRPQRLGQSPPIPRSQDDWEDQVHVRLYQPEHFRSSTDQPTPIDLSSLIATPDRTSASTASHPAVVSAAPALAIDSPNGADRSTSDDRLRETGNPVAAPEVEKRGQPERGQPFLGQQILERAILERGMLEADSSPNSAATRLPVDSIDVGIPHPRQIYPPLDVPAPVSHGPLGGRLDESMVRASQLPATTDGDGLDTIESAEDSWRGMVMGRPSIDDRGPPFGHAGIEFNVWWQDSMSVSLGLSDRTLPIDVASLTQIALASSPYIQGILTEPKIRQNDLVIADAEFDSLAFVEAKFADTNEPVGSDLTTGDNSDRFLDETLSSAAGLRKKNRGGSTLEVVQRGGFQDNNSTFLNPNPQGTTRLEINFSQPLLKDHGRAVNTTRVCLAQIDLELTNSDVREKLEEHLLSVTRAYWNLYAARAEWMQRNRLLESATELHGILQARREVDSHQRQVLRAQGAVASRRSDLVRAETRIRNAQARLRLLTGDPQLIAASHWELTPQDLPLAYPVRVSTREATLTALTHRPDIASSIRKIQAVSVRVGAAKNQVLPRLDMILSTYVAGLDAGHDTFGAFVNQFSDGRPSYAAGLLFEVPLGNRASRARLARSRWEMVRTFYEFQQTTETTFTEVEVAVRETETAYDEMFAKQQAIEAAQREVDYLQQRWELLPDPNESAILLIENLLDAQERLADEERAFTRSQVDYAISWVLLRKSMGVLLNVQNPSGRFADETDPDGLIIEPEWDAEAELAAERVPPGVDASQAESMGDE